MLGTAIVAVLVGGALLVATGGAADAAPAAPCTPTSLNKEIRQADVVFRGVVDKARAVRGKGDQRTRTYKVTAEGLPEVDIATALEAGGPHIRHVHFVDGPRDLQLRWDLDRVEQRQVRVHFPAEVLIQAPHAE